MWAASPKKISAFSRCARALIFGYSFLSHCSTRASSALLRAVQRLLASDAELRQQSTNGIGAQRDTKLIQDQLGHHVARPQSERKLQLQRILLCHGLVDPLHSSCIQFGRSSKQRLGLQRAPSTSPILRQPSVYRPATDP